jgi:hypothetical protein
MVDSIIDSVPKNAYFRTILINKISWNNLKFVYCAYSLAIRSYFLMMVSTLMDIAYKRESDANVKERILLVRRFNSDGRGRYDI